MTPTNDAESRAKFEAWVIACRDTGKPAPNQYSAWLGWQARDAEIVALRERLATLQAEIVACVALLPGPQYMDLPDGGSVTVAEQLRRMFDALIAVHEQTRQELVAREKSLDAALETMADSGLELREPELHQHRLRLAVHTARVKVETLRNGAAACRERGERNRIAAGMPNGDRDEFYCADDLLALADQIAKEAGKS